MAEYDGLPLTPVLVENFRSIFGGDRAHLPSSSVPHHKKAVLADLDSPHSEWVQVFFLVRVATRGDFYPTKALKYNQRRVDAGSPLQVERAQRRMVFCQYGGTRASFAEKSTGRSH